MPVPLVQLRWATSGHLEFNEARAAPAGAAERDPARRLDRRACLREMASERTRAYVVSRISQSRSSVLLGWRMRRNTCCAADRTLARVTGALLTSVSARFAGTPRVIALTTFPFNRFLHSRAVDHFVELSRKERRALHGHALQHHRSELPKNNEDNS